MQISQHYSVAPISLITMDSNISERKEQVLLPLERTSPSLSAVGGEGALIPGQTCWINGSESSYEGRDSLL